MRRCAEIFSRLRDCGPCFLAWLGPDLVVGRLGAPPPLTSWADVAALVRSAPPPLAPGIPGHVGYFSYEAGRWTHPIATRTSAPADAFLAPCLGGVTFAPGGVARSWGEGVEAPAPAVLLPQPHGRPPEWSSPAAYEQSVRIALNHIREGDCYQVNLARTVTVADPGDPLHAWLRLARTNPARRAMLLYTGERTILSNSPELLLGARGRELLSVPIKGTRPLAASPLDLLHSPKERAELTMIVDLVRADLANVARLGSVHAGPRRVGRVGHLWHAMQRVRATLDEGFDAVDALRALFPAGSVTGAPRVRATELIAALEEAPRGAYCGTMGWFGGDGSASWNVAIRTITFTGNVTRPDLASMHFGSGIVWGSDPVREREETEWKARKILAALCEAP